MKDTILRSIVVVSLLIIQPMQARAQWIVHDPATHFQAALSAVQTAISNVNEATQIANQIQQLYNDALNLTSLEYSMIDDFTTDFRELFQVMGEIDGMMREVQNVESRFDDLFPELHHQNGILNQQQMLQRTEDWIDENREVMEGAIKVGAKVLASLPKSQEEVDKLITDSQSAVGILQAVQAGNQVMAETAGQLMKLNTLISHQIQFSSTEMSRRTTTLAARRKRQKAAAARWKRPQRANMDLNIFD